MPNSTEIPLYSVVLLLGPADIISDAFISDFKQKNNTPIIVIPTSSYDIAEQDAFAILYKTLEIEISYPKNKQIVFINAGALSLEQIDKIIVLAKDNGYNVGNISLINEEVDNLSEDKLNSVYLEYLDHYNKNILPTIKDNKRYSFSYVADIRYKHNLVVSNKDIDLYNKCLCPEKLSKSEFLIVGDVHERVEELKELLDLTKADEKDIQVIYVGDINDKGGNTKDIIDFLYERKDKDIFVIGNHENYVYKKLKGLLTNDKKTEELEQTYFTSLEYLEKDENTRNKFFAIVEASLPFFKHPKFIVTHAPCKSKYLGKVSSKALTNQRTYHYPKRRDSSSEDEYKELLKEELKFIRDQARYTNPFHIFGHIASLVPITYKNEIGIDTGVERGHYLTGLHFDDDKYVFYHVKSKSSKKEPIPLISFI